MPIPKISSPGRAIYAAVSGTMNNKNKWRKYGVLSAIRSSQNREVTKALDPVLDDDGKLISSAMDGQRVIPTVKFQYDPKANWGGTNDYTKLDSGTEVAQPIEAQFQVKKVRQPNPILVPRRAWVTLEAEAKKYQQQLLSLDPVELGKAMAMIQKHSSAQEVARVLNKTMESSFFSPVEVQAINHLNTNAGQNPLYPDTDPGDPISINLFKTGTDAISVKLEDDMANLVAIMGGIEGRLIVVSGTAANVSTYFRRVLKSGLNSDGVQLGEMFKEGQVDHYTSDFIDATLGPNHFFVITPGAVAMSSQQEFRYLEGETIDGYTFTTLKMPAFDLALDFRFKETTHRTEKNGAAVDYVNPHPEMVFAPSLLYDFWAKPQGFHYLDTAHPFYAVNGIYHYVAE